MFRIFAFTLLLTVSLAGFAYASLTITLDDQFILPDLPGQVLTINVTGGDEVHQLDFFLQIGGGTSGPIIGGYDFVTDNIFNIPDMNGPGEIISGALGTRTIGVIVSFNSGATVSANGTIAKIILDTTGLTSGTFPYRLTNVTDPDTNQIFDTDFGGDENGPIIANFAYTHPEEQPPFSNLIILALPETPEPGTIVLAFIGLVGLCSVARAKRRARAVRQL